MSNAAFSAELAHVRRPRWVMPAVALGLVAVLLAMILVVPRFYRAHKRARGERMALVARAAIDRGDWQAAGQSVLMATSLAPDSPLALREAARLTTITGHPSAGQYWQLLFGRTQPTHDDRVMFCGLMLRLHRTDLVRPHLVALLNANARDPEAMELALMLLTLEGRPNEALLAARTLADEYPDRPGSELQLARTLVAAGGKKGRDEAKRILWSLAFRPKPDAFAALSELSRLPEASPDELRLLLRRVPTIQTNALFRLLVETNLRFRLEPATDRAAAAEAVVGAIDPARPIDERIVALDWLIANDRPSDALRITPARMIRTNTLVLQRTLQALARIDRWDEIARWVNDPGTDLAPLARHIYRAIIADHRHHPEEAATHLATAAELSGLGPDDLQLIAAYAEAIDQPRIAARALEGLLAHPILGPATAPRILGLLERMDSIPPMLQALDRLLAIDPGNDALRNDQAWLRMLSNDRLPETLDAVLGLADRHPDDPRYLATAALGWLRSGKPEKAHEMLEESVLGRTNAPVRARLVYCAAIGSTGRRDAARRMARDLSNASLRTEERILVQEWLEKPAVP